MSETSPLTPAGAVPVEQIRREAAALAILLAARRPEAARDARPVALDGSAVPARVWTFWEEVGYSKELLASLITAPDDPKQTEAVRRLVADWREQGEPGGAITLPARFRAVERYDAQDFWITDESFDAPDPPVVVGSEGIETLYPFCPSYLFLATKAVLGAAFFHTVIAGLRLHTEPAEARVPFPALAPRVRELPDGLWLLTLDHEAPSPDHQTDSVSTPSIEKLVTFLTALPAGSVMSLSAARNPLYVSKLPPTHELFDGLIDFAPAGANLLMRAGNLAGVPVLLTGAITGPLLVSVDDPRRQRIADALCAAGGCVG